MKTHMWRLATAALSTAILVVVLVIALTTGPACADCAVEWGWPLPLMKTAGFAESEVWHPVGLIVDGVVAILFSVTTAASAIAMVRRYLCAKARKTGASSADQ